MKKIKFIHNIFTVVAILVAMYIGGGIANLSRSS